MVAVRLSKTQEVVLPRSLGDPLGLRDGDQVEVRCQENVLYLRRVETGHAQGALVDLAGIVSSSLPVGSVDVERTMDRRGYEQQRSLQR